MDPIDAEIEILRTKLASAERERAERRRGEEEKILNVEKERERLCAERERLRVERIMERVDSFPTTPFEITSLNRKGGDNELEDDTVSTFIDNEIQRLEESRSIVTNIGQGSILVVGERHYIRHGDDLLLVNRGDDGNKCDNDTLHLPSYLVIGPSSPYPIAYFSYEIKSFVIDLDEIVLSTKFIRDYFGRVVDEYYTFIDHDKTYIYTGLRTSGRVRVQRVYDMSDLFSCHDYDGYPPHLPEEDGDNILAIIDRKHFHKAFD